MPNIHEDVGLKTKIQKVSTDDHGDANDIIIKVTVYGDVHVSSCDRLYPIFDVF